MEERFEHIKEQAKLMAKRQNACTEGFRKLVASTNLGELRAVLHQYWSDILAMLRKDNFMLLRESYVSYKAEFNAVGLWFNESTDQGKAIVTESGPDYIFTGSARVWIYNNGLATITGGASAVAYDRAELTLSHNGRAQMFDDSIAQLTGRSKAYLQGRSTAHLYVVSSVVAGEDSVVYAHSWNSITATGNAQIFALSSRKIKLLGNAKLTIKKEEDL